MPVTATFLPQTTKQLLWARSSGGCVPSPPKSSPCAAWTASTLNPPALKVAPPKCDQKSLLCTRGTQLWMPE